jgi:hypothetical protein
VYVTDLMKCKSREEFIALSKEYYQPWQEAIHTTSDRNGLKRASKEFAKARLGFVYTGDQVQSIYVDDVRRWHQVSMYQKVIECIPSTINALESFNRHCNVLIPRNNEFYHSTCRLPDQIEYGIMNWSTSAGWNFNHATRRAAILSLTMGNVNEKSRKPSMRVISLPADADKPVALRGYIMRTCPVAIDSILELVGAKCLIHPLLSIRSIPPDSS